MVLDVFAIYYRFTKIVSPPTVFKIFGPNLARLLKIYVPKKVWSEIVTFFTFGPSAALFWPNLSSFSSKRPKNGEKWAAKGPKLGNMIISDHTFFGRYILSNLAKFGPKIFCNKVYLLIFQKNLNSVDFRFWPNFFEKKCWIFFFRKMIIIMQILHFLARIQNLH